MDFERLRRAESDDEFQNALRQQLAGRFELLPLRAGCGAGGFPKADGISITGVRRIRREEETGERRGAKEAAERLARMQADCGSSEETRPCGGRPVEPQAALIEATFTVAFTESFATGCGGAAAEIPRLLDCRIVLRRDGGVEITAVEADSEPEF
jgi:hypothetical protein